MISVTLTPDLRVAVQIGSDIQFGDTYYLGLNPRHAEEPMPVHEGVKVLLKSWLDTLLAAADGSLIYLPFDFADEYTRWIACQRLGSEVSIGFGWAPVEGWSISPSDVSRHSKEVSNFHPDEPLNVHTVYRARFLSRIRHSIATLAPPDDQRSDT